MFERLDVQEPGLKSCLHSLSGSTLGLHIRVVWSYTGRDDLHKATLELLRRAVAEEGHLSRFHLRPDATIAVV